MWKEGPQTLSCMCEFPRWAQKADFSVVHYPPPSPSQTRQVLKGTRALKIETFFVTFLSVFVIFQSSGPADTPLR